MYESLLELAAEWGFVEDDALEFLHARIVTAIQTGNPTRDLWRQYLDVSERQVDFPDDGPRTLKARAGRQLLQGLIHLEAQDIVPGLACLILARATARNQDWVAEDDFLTIEIPRHGSKAEISQAQATYLQDAGPAYAEEAVAAYNDALALYALEQAKPTLTDEAQGLIAFHIAECYLGLIELNQQKVLKFLESAAALTQGSLMFPRVQAFIDQVSRQQA